MCALFAQPGVHNPLHSAAAAAALACPALGALPHPLPLQVLSDLSRAEVAAAQMHREFRELERRHTGAQLGLASLEVRRLLRRPCLPKAPLPLC